MTKCDVCGKTSLLPEKLGEVNICKICFLKANGPFWKKQYDRHDEAEKQRCKALTAAHNQNFPQPVVTAINNFFVNQMNNMLVCDCCGQPVHHRQSLGNANICSNCFGKINTSAWRETEYEDNESVEKNRGKILKIATKNCFPPIVVDGINKHFNSKIQKGLLFTFNGGHGQKLKVFVDHCVINTNSDEFFYEEISKSYSKAINNKNNKNTIPYGTIASVAQNLITGGVVRAGIGLATNAIVNNISKNDTNNAKFKVVNGNFTIDYRIYSSVEYTPAGESTIGFIKFINSRTCIDSDNIIFFFGLDNSTAKKAFGEICKGIDVVSKQSLQPVPTPPPAQQPATQQTPSVADELLKFKKLLDMGAITQEEYDAKKKSLLGM